MHNKERKDKHKESRWCVSFFSLCSLLWPLSTIWALDTSRWCVSFFSLCSLLWPLPTIWALDTGYCMWLRVLKRFSEKKILTSLGHCNESLSPVRVALESPSQLMHRGASAQQLHTPFSPLKNYYTKVLPYCHWKILMEWLPSFCLE